MDDSPDISIATSDRTPRQLELLSIERLDVILCMMRRSNRQGVFSQTTWRSMQLQWPKQLIMKLIIKENFSGMRIPLIIFNLFNENANKFLWEEHHR